MYTAMARVRSTLAVLNLISAATIVLGDAVAYFPVESRAANQFHYYNPQFQPISRNAIPPGFVLSHEHGFTQEQMEPQERIQPILHTNHANPFIPPPVPETPMEDLNFTGNDAPRFSEENYRAAKSGYEYPAAHAASYPQTPSYGYSPPAPGYSASAPAPPSYSAPAAPAPAQPSYAPPPAHHPQSTKFSILKPDITSLIKPVTTKVAGKVSGLIGLILSLLTGTAGDDLEMKGFKDLVINGIVKPLLIAKGGIKSLISKLTIPVISLLLINLEVLIVVWWLWEECPKPTYEYTKPSYTPNYNSYR